MHPDTERRLLHAVERQHQAQRAAMIGTLGGRLPTAQAVNPIPQAPVQAFNTRGVPILAGFPGVMAAGSKTYVGILPFDATLREAWVWLEDTASTTTTVELLINEVVNQTFLIAAGQQLSNIWNPGQVFGAMADRWRWRLAGLGTGGADVTCMTLFE